MSESHTIPPEDPEYAKEYWDSLTTLPIPVGMIKLCGYCGREMTAIRTSKTRIRDDDTVLEVVNIPTFECTSCGHEGYSQKIDVLMAAISNISKKSVIDFKKCFEDD